MLRPSRFRLPPPSVGRHALLDLHLWLSTRVYDSLEPPVSSRQTPRLGSRELREELVAPSDASTPRHALREEQVAFADLAWRGQCNHANQEKLLQWLDLSV